MTLRTFPIQGGWSHAQHKAIHARTIPWDMIAPHEAQALRNHVGQSLEILAARGGLSPCEAVAVLEDRPWHLMDVDESVDQLDTLIKQYVSRNH